MQRIKLDVGAQQALDVPASQLPTIFLRRGFHDAEAVGVVRRVQHPKLAVHLPDDPFGAVLRGFVFGRVEKRLLAPLDRASAPLHPLPDEPLGAGVEIRVGDGLVLPQAAAHVVGGPCQGPEAADVGHVREVDELLEAGRVPEVRGAGPSDAELVLDDGGPDAAAVAAAVVGGGRHLDEEEVVGAQGLVEILAWGTGE
ncbi:uncharacterized protein PG986_002704 [Apiospora aurea]|uniref:Uncharacterized protein n=1 Tax=Apiospora aurea TaxID=335848 RepID=A0ABR1QPL6_9PEZI